MSATIILEGGARGELRIRCREGFRKLLESCGYTDRMPRLFARGSRNAVFDDFKTAHASSGAGDYVAMWIDSEEPLRALERTWEHLKRRDDWDLPAGATDEQVLFMTTCMETMIVADHVALRDHYKVTLQTSALPPLDRLEERGRHDVQDRLVHATRECSNAYSKGKRSYEVLAKLAPNTLQKHLPSFARTRRILDGRLPH